MTSLSIPSFLTPLPAGLSAPGAEFMLAGAETLNVATAEQGGFASLASLPQAPRLGEAPNGYHPFSSGKMQKAREWFRGQAGDLKVSPDRAEALGEKILSNLRCVDPITFRQALIQMGIAVKKFVGEEPYRLIINKPFRSHWFLYQSLRTMGLIPEAAGVSDLSGQIISGDLFEQLDEIRNEELKVVVLDDCSYKGDALRADYLFELPDRASIDTARIFIGLIASMQKGWDFSFLSSVAHYVGLRINCLESSFDSKTREVLTKSGERNPFGILPPSSSGRPSTFTWYKLPDNLNYPLELCGLKNAWGSADKNGNQVLPSSQPLYYEMLHPDLLTSFPPDQRHALREEVKMVLEEEGPSGVAEYLQFVSTKSL
ncbi:MAG: hypothetical protein Q8P84_05610 [Deltaproteobacteria bacterium]|nr:hypothetical protein [Deltaproteobacteria bacterium]